MAQLAADVSATALRWRVDSLPAARYLKADDEIVEVLSRRRLDTTIRVRRGIEGTVAASHDSGAELTAPAFGGGGEQNIRRLGPYSFAFDDAGIGSGQVEIGDLAAYAGALVLTTVVIPIVQWTVAAGTFVAGSSVFINVGPTDDTLTVASYENPNGTSIIGEWEPTSEEPDPVSNFWKRSMLIPANAKVWAEAYPPGGTTFNAGEADVFLLVAEAA